ncbi:MAG: tetratricopeptide repeat protein [Gammaproteobacteria bacterium]|nr:MAG: tetratricopeptide repeat protein [Gammaproteobacteria bacterium]
MTVRAEAELQRALEIHRAGRLPEAQAMYREILGIHPNHPDALNLLGVIAHQQGQPESATALIRQAIHANPGVPEYYNNLGEALMASRKLDDAIVAYRRARALNPDYAEAHNNLGIALREHGRVDDAIEAFKRAVTVQPDFAEAHYNLGNALHESGALPEAVAAYRAAVALESADAEMRNNLGVALVEQGEVTEALAEFERALALKPDFAEAHTNRGLALLLTGELQQGWREYEWRFASKDEAQRGALREFPQPRWDGANFSGDTVLVHTEQGFGDTIQFARFVPVVKERGGRVLLACDPQLRRLLETSLDVDAVVGDPSELPADIAFDLQVPMLSLAAVFDTHADTIPRNVPYLHAEPAQVQAWSGRLQQGTYKVGICWAGRATPRNRHRACSLTAFAPLARVAGVSFCSLQKGPAANEADNPPHGMELTDYSKELNDFADTAALVSNLDLVITIDTAVAHLAGALGRPVWTLLSYVPAWSYLLGREDSLWYPTMRLFRQPGIGDWESVMEQVVTALISIVSSKR